MTLDIPTLFLTLTLGLLLLVAELTMALRSWAKDMSLRDWAVGSATMVIGFLILQARVWLPVWFTVTVGNTLACVGCLMCSQAIYRFLSDQAPPRWGRWVGPLLLLLMALMVDWPLHVRVAVVSGFIALSLLPGVLQILGVVRSAERSLLAVGLMLVLAILAMLTRAAHALLHPEFHQVFNQASTVQGYAFLSLQGAGWGFVLAVLERTATRLEVQAAHDGLTGCLNRGAGEVVLAHALKLSQRDHTPLAFVLMDLDHFKEVNDQFGHRMGDTALRLFARTVQGRLRGSDVLCRMGGEEFGLILPGTDEAGALRLAEKIRLAVRSLDLRADAGDPVELDFSAGVAVALPAEDGEAASSVDRLYGRADLAMYEAKRAGRGRVLAAAGH